MSETFDKTDNPAKGEVVDALNDPSFTPPAEDGPYEAAGGEAKPAPGLVAPVPNTRKEGQARRVRVPSPTYLPQTQQVVIPVVNGVGYRVNDEPVSGVLSLDEARSVTAVVEGGHQAWENSHVNWTFGDDSDN